MLSRMATPDRFQPLRAAALVAAAMLLTAEATNTAIRATVVIHAAKRGPRTSTSSMAGWSMVIDMDVLLLLTWLRDTGRGTAVRRRDERRNEESRLLSSYSNNSNNPLRGTDPLRGVW